MKVVVYGIFGVLWNIFYFLQYDVLLIIRRFGVGFGHMSSYWYAVASERAQNHVPKAVCLIGSIHGGLSSVSRVVGNGSVALSFRFRNVFLMLVFYTNVSPDICTSQPLPSWWAHLALLQ